MNVTDSAVRITHLPTGVVVSCQNERSQTQNKAKAMQILAARLAERQREEQRKELEALSGDKRDVAFGSQIRTYTLAPYQLVKDERTRYETGNVQAVLDGDLDAFIEAYLQWRRERRVSSPDPVPSIGWYPRRALPMIRFENVTKTYKGDVVALRDVSLEIAKGEFVFLVGPSGSGKSTFLKLLLRDEVATDGRVLVAGRDIGRLGAWKVPQLRRNIGCVFQDFKLLTEQDGLRERRVRARGDRPPEAHHPHAGAADPRPRRPHEEVRQLPDRAVGW